MSIYPVQEINMKIKKIPALTTGILTFSLCACCILPCSASAEEETNFSGTPFSELVYQPFDDSILLSLISEIRSKMDDPANVDEISDLLDQIDDQYALLDQTYTLADLYSSLDVTDDYYSEQESATYSLFCTVDDELNTLYRDLLSSSCSSALGETLTEDDISYYSDYSGVSSDQLSLEKQEQDLIAQYEELYNQEFTCDIDGQACTYNDICDLYDNGDITDDEYTDAYMQLMKNENNILGPVFVELVKVRQQLAKYYGYDTYTDYAYAETYLRDYSPEDAAIMEKEVKAYLIDAYETARDHYDADAVSVLDEQISSMTIEEQMDMIQPYFSEIDQDLADNFTFLRTNHLYDMEYSDTKVSTGFTTWFSVAEEPFIFNQPYGSFYDLDTLIHEFGHFNAMLMENGNIGNYDLAEIHSQGLVMLCTRFYPEIFEDILGDAAVNYELLNIIESITDGCLYDEFQQKVYELENPTLEEINQIYYDTAVLYGNDYGDYTSAYEWVDIPHNFSDPLYYISYATSAVPALELWSTMQNNPDTADDIYMEIVYSGDYSTYQDTLANCNLANPFSEGAIKYLAGNIQNYFR